MAKKAAKKKVTRTKRARPAALLHNATMTNGAIKTSEVKLYKASVGIGPKLKVLAERLYAET